MFGGAVHLHIDRTKRRTSITGHKTRRIQTGSTVPRFLDQHQTDKGLRSVQQDRRLFQIEPVVERDILPCHRASPHLNDIDLNYNPTLGHKL